MSFHDADSPDTIELFNLYGIYKQYVYETKSLIGTMAILGGRGRERDRE
jgi:hypothetical protein